MKYTHYTPKRVKQPDRPRWRLPVLLAAVLVSLGLLMAPNGEAHVAEALPPPPPPPPPRGALPYAHARTHPYPCARLQLYPARPGGDAGGDGVF